MGLLIGSPLVMLAETVERNERLLGFTAPGVRLLEKVGKDPEKFHGLLNGLLAQIEQIRKLDTDPPTKGDGDRTASPGYQRTRSKRILVPPVKRSSPGTRETDQPRAFLGLLLDCRNVIHSSRS